MVDKTIPEVETLNSNVDKECWVVINLQKNRYLSCLDTTSEILYATKYDSFEAARRGAKEYENEQWHHVPFRFVKIHYKCTESMEKLESKDEL